MRRVLNSRIFKIIYTVFVIIFTIVISFYLLIICLQEKDLFGYSFYIMPDNSMEDFYHKNDVLIVQKIDKLILELGNDIVYYGVDGGLKDKLIIHRIIKIDNTDKKEVLFTTQALKSSITDPPIKKKQILGKVTSKEKFLSMFIHLINNPVWCFIIIFLPLIIILIIEIIRTSIALKLEKINYDLPILIEYKEDRGKHVKKKKSKNKE